MQKAFVLQFVLGSHTVWLDYTINKNKPIFHARNVNQWKGWVEPRPFIGLLILDMINRFIFGHGVVIYYIYYWE